MIFAVPLYDDNPVRRPPVVNYFLIGLCIGAFYGSSVKTSIRSCSASA